MTRATIDHSRRLSTIREEQDHFNDCQIQAEIEWLEFVANARDDEETSGYPLPIGWERGE